MRTILILFFIISPGCEIQIPFDSDNWKSGGGESIMTDKRLNMSNDLLKRNLLIGKDSNEIESLIGPNIRTIHVFKNAQLYEVKEVWSFNIDPEYLIFIKVDFDNKGKSTKAILIKSTDL